jgi:putative transposase
LTRLIQIDGGQKYWLWIAYEPKLNVCLMMHLSRERTIFFVCYQQFFKRLRSRYGRKPIFTDGALWYDDDACKWLLRLKHQVYGTELKNLMERFIQQIKDRTECFDDYFPCRKPDCDRQHVWNWLKKLFVLYLNARMDRMKFTALLSTDGGG